jgi:hypothetical protein
MLDMVREREREREEEEVGERGYYRLGMKNERERVRI